MSNPETKKIIELMEGLVKLQTAFEQKFQSKKGIIDHPSYKRVSKKFDETLKILASYQYTVERCTDLRDRLNRTRISDSETTIKLAGSAVQNRECEGGRVLAFMSSCENDPDETQRETLRVNQTIIAIQEAGNPDKKRKEKIKELKGKIDEFIKNANGEVETFKETQNYPLTETVLERWRYLSEIQQTVNEARGSVNKRLRRGNGGTAQQGDTGFQNTIKDLLHSLSSEECPDEILISKAKALEDKIKDSPFLGILSEYTRKLTAEDLPPLCEHAELMDCLIWLKEKEQSEDGSPVKDAVTSLKEKSLLKLPFSQKGIEQAYEKHAQRVDALLKDYLNRFDLEEKELVTVDENLEKLSLDSLSELEKKIKKFPSHKSVKEVLLKTINNLSTSISKLSVDKEEVAKETKGKTIAQLQKTAELLYQERSEKREKVSAEIAVLKEKAKGLSLEDIGNKSSSLTNQSASFSQAKSQLLSSIEDLKKRVNPLCVDNFEREEFRALETELAGLNVRICKMHDESKRLQKRIEVNDLIERNKTAWKRLDSKTLASLKVKGADVSENDLALLSEDASMQDIEKEAEWQKVLAEELKKHLHEQTLKQAALDDLKGKGENIFTGEKTTHWNEYCKWFQEQHESSKDTTIEKLCSIQEMFNDLKRQSSDEKKLYEKASNALVGAMQESCSKDAPESTSDLKSPAEKIKQLYKARIEGLLPLSDSSDVDEQTNEKRLEREKVIFLQNIVDDVFKLTTVNEQNPVLPQLLTKAQKRNNVVLNEINSIADILKGHFDSNAAGKTTIESVVEDYKAAYQDVLKVKSEETESVVNFNKIVALRASNRQAVPVLEKIKMEADGRKNAIGGFKRCLIDAKHFFQYVYRKYFGGSEDKIKSFADYNRLSIYNSISEKAGESISSVSVEQEPSDPSISSTNSASPAAA